jgi:hypothetical protein
VIVIVAAASELGSATLVAFTTAIWGAVTEGGVKRPELEIFPAVVIHWTAVLLVPRMLAVKF